MKEVLRLALREYDSFWLQVVLLGESEPITLALLRDGIDEVGIAGESEGKTVCIPWSAIKTIKIILG